VLVDLGKMKPSDSEYACRVTLKRMEAWGFVGTTGRTTCRPGETRSPCL
jgi:hypothetical protein